MTKPARRAARSRHGAGLIGGAMIAATLSMLPGAVRAEPATSESRAVTDLSTAGFESPDELFSRPYIDIDEMREGVMPYRYVHGGFEGTDTRFSFHFPLADAFEGRFFQYITPVPDSETRSQGLTGEEDRIGAALTSGGYFIETNGGGPKAADPMSSMDKTIGAYRANAAAARFSRHLAAQIYGDEAHVHGYAYGGSGGAYRTIGSIENSEGVWDGAVPYVLGSPMAIPNVFTVRLQAMRLIGEKFDDVVDALDAGGSGDPYAGLDEEQARALAEVTKMGFPPESWYAWRSMGPHGFAVLFNAIRMVDAAYFTDFWTRPGYDGHDNPDRYADARVQFDTRITGIITADEAEAMGLEIGHMAGTAAGTADRAYMAMGLDNAGEVPVAFRLADTPPEGWLMLSDLILPSGRKVLIGDVEGDLAILGQNDPRLIATVTEGTDVRLDNSDILAVQSYQRHQLPTNGQYPVFDQYRDAEGQPLYPQRRMLLGPIFTRAASGTVPTGRFDGKIILIENLWDREAYPWQGDWYRQRVIEHKGNAADQHFRLWMTDHATHGDHSQQDDPTRVVSYIGVLQQALRDVAAWVEDGIEPSPTTAYTIADGQVAVPAEAADRHGIQPVVTLAVKGRERAEVKAGKTVTLSGRITAPPGTGSIVAAQWDFDGDGIFDAAADLDDDAGGSVRVTATHGYDEPGTYFAVLRGISQREGDRETPFARIQNLARVRIVVK